MDYFRGVRSVLDRWWRSGVSERRVSQLRHLVLTVWFLRVVQLSAILLHIMCILRQISLKIKNSSQKSLQQKYQQSISYTNSRETMKMCIFQAVSKK